MLSINNQDKPIHLINMPFASIVKPVLALGLIKSRLAEYDIQCKTHYFNLDFAQMLGLEHYELLLSIKRSELQLNEWFFTKEAWGKDFFLTEPETIELALRENPVLKKIGFNEKKLSIVRNEIVPAFLDMCIDKICTESVPAIAAFTSLYFQNIPVIALIKRLKKRFPQISIICGGPNFHSEMGDEFIHKIPQIDAVSIGEADDIFLPLFKAFLLDDASKRDKNLSKLQGLIYRDRQGIIKYGPQSSPVSSDLLDSMPDPDYSEYFEQINKTPLANDFGWKRTAYIPFESSRGCWKGFKQHCAFCGLNHQGLGFRARDPQKVEAMLRNFSKKYPIKRYHATDNIMPRSYFDTLLEKLAKNRLPDDISLYWETRSNLKRRDFLKLSKAGIKIIQTGIENLDTDLLKLIRKGVRAIDNIFFLKLARTFGIHILWFFLAGIPGETKENYKKICDLIPKIIHFQPPFQDVQYLELHKFSPFYNENIVQKDKWAQNVKPRLWYNSLYPKDINIDNIAYFYDADWNTILDKKDMLKLKKRIKLWIDIWQKSPCLPKLEYSVIQNGNLVINDSRTSYKTGQWQLDSFESTLYMAINDPSNIHVIKRVLLKKGFTDFTDNEIIKILDNYVESGLAVKEKKSYLGLALPEGCFEPAISWRYRECRFETSHLYTII